MTTILFVRIKSKLDFEEIERRARERLPRFQQVPGLVQKFYGHDETTGDVCLQPGRQNRRSAGSAAVSCRTAARRPCPWLVLLRGCWTAGAAPVRL